jgi:hypothetical protein
MLALPSTNTTNLGRIHLNLNAFEYGYDAGAAVLKSNLTLDFEDAKFLLLFGCSVKNSAPPGFFKVITGRRRSHTTY